MKRIAIIVLLLLLIPTVAAQPQPTFKTNNTAVFVLFKIGKWVRVAYNNTKAVPPLYVYVYSKSPVKVSYRIVENNKTKLKGNLSGTWGYVGTIGTANQKGLAFITINGKTIRIFFIKQAVKQQQEQVIVFRKSVIVHHAQFAIVLAVLGILTAYVIKRKTLLLSPFNALNFAVAVGLTATLGYYLQFVRTDSTFWLALVFLAAEITSYSLFSAGRRVWFMQILPSVREVLIEEGVLYKCKEGLAFAAQNLEEAIKRWRGQHMLLRDKEIGEVGKFSEDKMFKVIYNEVDWCEAILALSAKIRRLKYDKAKKI